MAPVLLCPECGAKHPLTGVNGSAFPCQGCGRTLKVPEQAQAAVPGAPASPAPAPAAAPAARPPVPESSQTRVMPASAPPLATDPDSLVPETPKRSRRTGPINPVPSRWIRFALWVVAVPLAFVIVFGVAKLIGVLNSNQVENVALDEGWNRFVPIARLMPFVALVTAGLVQGGVYGIARMRAKRHAPPAEPVEAPAISTPAR